MDGLLKKYGREEMDKNKAIESKMTHMEGGGDIQCVDIILCSHHAKGVSRTHSSSWSSSWWHTLYVSGSKVQEFMSFSLCFAVSALSTTDD